MSLCKPSWFLLQIPFPLRPLILAMISPRRLYFYQLQDTFIFHEKLGLSFLLIFLQIKLFHFYRFSFHFQCSSFLLLWEKTEIKLPRLTLFYLIITTSERVQRGRYNITTNQIHIHTKHSCSLFLNFWPVVVTELHMLLVLTT